MRCRNEWMNELMNAWMNERKGELVSDKGGTFRDLKNKSSAAFKVIFEALHLSRPLWPSI